MKIALVFGKGIDGCGVTRGAFLLEKYLYKHGHSTIVVDFDNNNTYMRSKNYTWLGEVYKVNSVELQVSDDLISIINKCDICIFHSYPTRKQYNYVERYRLFIEKINHPIMVMHDHGITSNTIGSIPQACELFSYADVVVVQSLNGLSNDMYTKFDSGITNRVLENPIWIEPSAHAGFPVPYEARQKHIICAGRMSPLKDPVMLCRLDSVLPFDWNMTLLGCEHSISSVDDTYGPYSKKYTKKILQYTSINSKKPLNCGASINDEVRMKSYDQYDHISGMKMLGNSFFAWCGYRLANSLEYGSRMEYTMIESFLLTLPIISKDFASNAKSPDGIPWGDYNAALIYNPGEELQLADKLLSIDKNEWNNRTSACKELILKFNDINILAKNYLDKILNLGKRTDKINAIDKICEFFPDAKCRRENKQIVMSNSTSIMNNKPHILVDGKANPVVYEKSNQLLDNKLMVF